MIILLYGRPKVGKSTMTKDHKTLEVEKMTVADARILKTLKIDAPVLIIDSSTVLLDLLERSIAAAEGVSCIADIEWAKGKPRLLTRFRDVVNNLTADKITVIISHERMHESKYLSLLTPEIDEWLQIRADWVCALRNEGGKRTLHVRNVSYLGHRDIPALNALPDMVELPTPKDSQTLFNTIIANLLKSDAAQEAAGDVVEADKGPEADKQPNKVAEGKAEKTEKAK